MLYKACGQLYPREVRELRTFLLSQDNPICIMMWLMILTGIKLFFRVSELVKMKVEDLEHSYSPKGKEYDMPARGFNTLTRCQVVHENYDVRTIVVEVHGKRDIRPVRLAILCDYDCPEFDLLVHILWYMKLFNIQSGYIFPTPDVLIAQWKSGCVEPLNATDHIKYATVLMIIKRLITKVCKRDIFLFTVATHILRKTAYLFAVWGYMNQVTMESYKALAIPCELNVYNF